MSISLYVMCYVYVEPPSSQFRHHLLLNKNDPEELLPRKAFVSFSELVEDCIGCPSICPSHNIDTQDSRTHHEPTLNLRLFAVLMAVKINSYVPGIHQLRYSALVNGYIRCTSIFSGHNIDTQES
jgi:hypothetical protein